MTYRGKHVGHMAAVPETVVAAAAAGAAHAATSLGCSPVQVARAVHEAILALKHVILLNGKACRLCHASNADFYDLTANDLHEDDEIVQREMPQRHQPEAESSPLPRHLW